MALKKDTDMTLTWWTSSERRISSCLVEPRFMGNYYHASYPLPELSIQAGTVQIISTSLVQDNLSDGFRSS